MLVSFAGALKAGYSAARALPEAAAQMEVLYGHEAMICRELQRMLQHMEMNRRPEDLFADLADASRIPDAAVFADVFAIISRSGGDMISVVSRTAEMIMEKMRTAEEIRAAYRARQYEQRLMYVMPLAIMLYMKAVSPGFMDAVYGNVPGTVIMTAALGLYLLALLLGRRITGIEV